jgi:Protein of unknown function (DUF2442)
MIRITAAQALRPYWVRLTFSDGAVKEVDFGDLISSGPVFAAIRESDEVFSRVRVNPESGTVEWPRCPRTREGERETSGDSERARPRAEEAPIYQVDFDPDVLYGRFEPASGAKIERRTIREPLRAAP